MPRRRHQMDLAEQLDRALKHAIEQVGQAARPTGSWPDRVLLERIEQLARVRAVLAPPKRSRIGGRVVVLLLSLVAVAGGAIVVFLGPATTELAVTARVTGVGFVIGSREKVPGTVSGELIADRVVLHEATSVDVVGPGEFKAAPASSIEIVRSAKAAAAGPDRPHISIAPIVVPATTRVDVRLVSPGAVRFEFGPPAQVRVTARSADVEVLDPRSPRDAPARHRVGERAATVAATVHRLDVARFRGGEIPIADTVRVARLDFARSRRVGHPLGASHGEASTVLGGELRLLDAGARRYEFLHGDHMVTETADGSLHELRVRDDTLTLQFRGVVSGLRYGMSSADRMPRYFDVLSNQHQLAMWWTAGTYILITGLGVIRWWGGQS
jgi:hypothetical protein